MNYEQFLEKILEHAYEAGSFNSRNLIDKAKHVCIWGTGRMFHEAYEQYFVKTGIKVDYLCDNDPEKWGKEYLGILCIPPSQLKSMKDTVVIPLIGDCMPVERQLREMKVTTINLSRLGWDFIADLPLEKEWFKKEIPKIKQAYHFLEDTRSKEVFVNILCNRIAPELSQKQYTELWDPGEYFSPNIKGFTVGTNEIFCDAGAYVGDSIQRFVKHTEGAFGEVYAFEADRDNYAQCCETICSFENSLKKRIHCYQYGVGVREGSIIIGKEKYGGKESISALKAANLDFDDNQKSVAKIVRLDEFLSEKHITLLKMDIEGMERDALEGAEGLLINSDKLPKLAVCIYHRVDDLWNIPFYIKSIAPKYKINIRHHTKDKFWGTVCYAYS